MYNTTVNFISPAYPISIAKHKHVYVVNDTRCVKHDTVWDEHNEPGFHICPQIRHNFHIKQIVCLSVFLFYIDNENGIEDGIWYIHKY